VSTSTSWIQLDGNLVAVQARGPYIKTAVGHGYSISSLHIFHVTIILTSHPPPMSNPPGYTPPVGWASRVKNQNLRSLVLPIALVGFAWTLSDSISSFQEISTDNSQHEKKLANLSIALGSLYAGAAAIFLFGVFAAASKRLALIRIFSFLSAAASIIVIASGFLRTIVHFVLKNALIGECTALATGQNVVSVWGVWNSDPGHNLTPDEANRFCRRAWKHDSFAEIFWLIVEIILLPMFTFVAFAYARQESESVNGRGRSSIPTTYAPAYAAGVDTSIALPEMAYDHLRYAPPPDSPPPFDKTLPGYGGGEMDKKDNESMRTMVEDDPFGDYDELPRLK